MMGVKKITTLSTRNLSVGYTNPLNILFENINLSLNTGELVCFMGPNGIGKSTLIRTLAGLQNPLRGTLTHPGLSENKSDKTHSISVVLTDKISALNMTVQELVTYGRYPHLGWNISLTAEDNQTIAQAIAQTHIEHLTAKKLFELSDGQVQMVMIARALAQDTPIILLDEPTAHLDLNNRVEIMNLLRNLARHQQKTILVSTHELDLALQTADWIWLAGRDRNIVTGIPEDLVLNGTFDAVFQFKGFDLKTGKVFHEAQHNTTFQLVGEGYELLWTKNALERCGYPVSGAAPQTIAIVRHGNQVSWQYHNQTFNSLAELITVLPRE
jgi:iron complex transport system ATP-binding protein